MQNIDCSHRFKLEQVDGAPSHIPAPAPAHISLHIKIPKCVSRVLIHRAITFDTFKVLAKKPKRSWVTIKISDPKSYFLMASDPQTCPTAPLYFSSSLLSIWYATWLYLYKMNFGPFGATPPGPAPRGLHQNSECVPPVLIHRAITCDSFKALAIKAWEELGDNKKKNDPKSYFLTSSDPQTCPRGIFFFFFFCTTVFYSS